MPREEKLANFNRLTALQDAISEEKHAAYIGKTVRCLVDAWDDLEEDGRTGSYNPIAARFPEQVEANRDYLRTTLLHSLNLARSACALLELGHWQGAVENILYLGLPMVEEMVFTGRWKAVNHQNRRRIS